MNEIELKFQVPVAQRKAVHRALATAKARTLRLQAQYFDTPDQRLAKAHVSLRLRQEGDDWVQTLKCPGENRWTRLEHEVPRKSEDGEPVLDVALHAGTAAGAQLAAALGDQAASLQVYYATDVQRTLRMIRSAGVQAEVALDVGEIRAGSDTRALHEIEFELKTGAVDALVALATRWVERHGLWVDVISKAERGQQLAQRAPAVAPLHAQAVVLKEPYLPDAALRQMVGACLAHLLPNAAEVAGGAAEPEHVHQTRVALRRLRTALRIYGDWSPGVDAHWEPALATLFGQLGGVRDRDALEAELLPALRAAGAPLAELPAEAADTAIDEVLRAPATTCLWLALIAFANGAPQPVPPSPPAAELRALAAVRLDQLQRQLAKDAKAYADFADEQRHRARRRLKRLRYAIEFAASLFREKKVQAYLQRLKPAQDALGQYNDLVVAEQAFGQLLPAQPEAWFALGWLAARRTELLDASQRRLRKWAKAPGFW
ncbi:CYTH and CHAD domain-containing protein [Pantoea sp. 18069]|uniref:CYTH and CHAD domain-containing protein n=1 Tax=Pantoea sp. 18069 TaxID=2681415 RepID=UPI001358A9A8|nr:CYTH and CHAD domain-containing protein [Pantoea sp. 18069]